MDILKKAVLNLKDHIVKSPLERSVYEACTDQNWVSSNYVLHEISEKTFNHEDWQIILNCICDLLKSTPKEWRRLYKVLNLIENILKFGSTTCLHDIQDEASKIAILQDFSFREGSEEKGTGIRNKAKYITSMLKDRKTLDEEREKAQKIWSKFSGNAHVSDSLKSSNSPSVAKKYDSGEVKESEVKLQKLENKESVWGKEPERLPASNRVIELRPTGNGGDVIEDVTVEKFSESVDDGMLGGILPGKAAESIVNALYGVFGGVSGKDTGSSRSVPGLNDPGAFGYTGNEFLDVGGSHTNLSGGDSDKTSFPSSTTNTASLSTNPSLNPNIPHTNPSHLNPAPLLVNPFQLFTNPAVSQTNPKSTVTEKGSSKDSPKNQFKHFQATITEVKENFLKPSKTIQKKLLAPISACSELESDDCSISPKSISGSNDIFEGSRQLTSNPLPNTEFSSLGLPGKLMVLYNTETKNHQNFESLYNEERKQTEKLKIMIEALKGEVEDEKISGELKIKKLLQEIKVLKTVNLDLQKKIKQRQRDAEHEIHTMLKKSATKILENELETMEKSELLKQFNHLKLEYKELSKKLLKQADEMFEKNIE